MTIIHLADGCYEKPNARVRLEGAYGRYSELVKLMNSIMDFTYTLERFDLEDAAYKQKAEAALDEGLARHERILEIGDELADFEYGKDLSELRSAMMDFLSELDRAMEETGAILKAAKDILQALEPTLRVEAELTMMDPPENNQAQLERLIMLDEAISRTLQELDAVEVPEVMELYKELNREMFESLQNTAVLLMRAINGEVPIIEQPFNPDFDRFQLILENYREVVRSIHENLKVYQLDALSRKVDRAFYELFMEYPEEEEP